MPPPEKIKLGISSCLLGERVRWDGAHKREPLLSKTLAPFIDWVPVCPEFEVGMGVPRETVHLIGSKGNPKMIGTASGKHWTAAMKRYSRNKLADLARQHLSGFIFKSKSPSCGLTRIQVYESDSKGFTQGLFAKACIQQFPLLPMEEEHRLRDIQIRQHFLTRVIGLHRLQTHFQHRKSLKQMIQFHNQHRFLLQAHDRKGYKALEGLVENAGTYKWAEFRWLYSRSFMKSLSRKSTVAKNIHVLQQLFKLMSEDLSRADARKLIEAIEVYQNGEHPLKAPLPLFKRLSLKYKNADIAEQSYLNPHPAELTAQNHV